MPTLTFHRGNQRFSSALAALRATRQGPYLPLHASLADGASPSRTDLLDLAFEHTRRHGESAEQAAEAAYVHAQLAGLEQPSPPPFPVTFSQTVRTQRGELDTRNVMQAEMRARLYLNPQHTYPGLKVERDAALRYSLLFYIWTPEAGYPDFCAGTVQTSTRPYAVTDRCDGTRDDAALYALRLFCHHLGMTQAAFEAHHRAAYPDEVFQPPVTWFSQTWRNEEVSSLPVNAESYVQVLESLYSMNHRSLVAEFEPHVQQFTRRGA